MSTTGILNHGLSSILLMAFTVSAAHAQQAALWTLEPDLVYAEPADAPLTRITGILGRASGEAYVLDVNDPGVLRFDARGAYLGRGGGAGEGPGEFRSRSALGAVNDSVWVLDSRLGRVTFFGPEFSGARTFTPPRVERSLMAPLAALAGGRTLLQAGDHLDRMSIMVVDPDATVRADHAIDWGRRNLVVTISPMERVIRNPWTFGTAVGVAADGRHFALAAQPRPASPERADYAVSVFDSRGDSVWSARVGYRPESVPAAEVDAWIEGMESASVESRGISRRSLLAAVRDSLGEVRFRAPVVTGTGGIMQSVLVEAGGDRVWIRRGQEEWDVVGPGGREAVLRAPDGVALLAVAGEYAWGVGTDEFDVPRIHRFRISRN